MSNSIFWKIFWTILGICGTIGFIIGFRKSIVLDDGEPSETFRHDHYELIHDHLYFSLIDQICSDGGMGLFLGVAAGFIIDLLVLGILGILGILPK